MKMNIRRFPGGVYNTYNTYNFIVEYKKFYSIFTDNFYIKFIYHVKLSFN